MQNTHRDQESGDWIRALNRKARLLADHLASLRTWVSEVGGSDAMLEQLSAPYYEALRSLYEEDFPLARAVEASDLLIRVEGPAISEETPRISVIASIFSDVRGQVGRLAKTIAGLSEIARRIPKEMDLGLAAFARGSLYLGFTLPSPAEPPEGEVADLFPDERLYEAAKAAIRTLGIVSKHISESGGLNGIDRVVPDPRVRDAALLALENLAPTGKKGIVAVSIGGKNIKDLGLQRLTPEIRSKLRVWLERPLLREESATFVGVVREIDLDYRRFELRRLEDQPTDSVRCIYSEEFDDIAKTWIDRQLRVSGPAEKDASGKPRLLHAVQVEIVL